MPLTQAPDMHDFLEFSQDPSASQDTLPQTANAPEAAAKVNSTPEGAPHSAASAIIFRDVIILLPLRT